MQIALPAIGAFTIVLFILALALVIADLAFAVYLIVENLPFPLNKLAPAVKAISQAITNACGKVESGIDKLIGAAWHQSARQMDRLWHEIEHHALNIYQASSVVHSHAVAINELAAKWRSERAVAKARGGRIAHIEHELHGIDRKVREIEHELSKGIGEDVLPKIKSLDRELTKIEQQVIPGIRSAADTAEGEVTALGRYIADNLVTKADIATEATAAAVLTAAGLNWLRCNSNPFMNNRGACGLWGDLANLLALAAVDIAALASLYELVGIAQDVTPTVTKLASDILKV